MVTDNEQWHTKEAARNNFFIVRGEDGTGSVFSKRNHQHLGDAIASATQHLQVQHGQCRVSYSVSLLMYNKCTTTSYRLRFTSLTE